METEKPAKEVVLQPGITPERVQENAVSKLKFPPGLYTSHAHVHQYTEAHFQEALAMIKQSIPPNWSPSVAVICGSGLGGFGETLGNLNDDIPPISLLYENIPHFPMATVHGHSGKLMFGSIEGIATICMVGRFHFYEGHALYQTAFPVRIFALLGVKTVIVTNAAGSLNHELLKNGDIMLIRDHINMPGIAGHNPLVGPNIDRFGPRFPAISDAYNYKLRKKALDIYKDLKLEDKGNIHEGVYIYVAGPSYETPAEAKMLRMMGADAVGMSTVPEVIVARHCGLDVLGLSLITNKVYMPEDILKMENGQNVEKASHEEVLEMSKKRARVVEALVREIIRNL